MKYVLDRECSCGTITEVFEVDDDFNTVETLYNTRKEALEAAIKEEQYLIKEKRKNVRRLCGQLLKEEME